MSESIDNRELERMLDRTRTGVFYNNNAAFLSSIMCSMGFQWSDEIPTAAVDGITLFWNKDFYLRTPMESNKTVLVHELWHPAMLHFARMGDRDPKLWNIACDHWINIPLKDEGYSFQGLEWAFADRKYRGWVEEDIYDDLVKTNFQPPPNYQPDLKPCPKGKEGQAINAVVKAVQAARIAGTGTIPGSLETILRKFLTPVIKWEDHLQQWMTDLMDYYYTWLRPNRRYTQMYMPSKDEDEGRLEHLAYFQDVSGSIEDADNLRFNSELKYVNEIWNPKRMTLLQFDTRITDIKEFTEEEPFEEIKIVGRGGTSLVPVRDWIIQNQPTAAIIFSDLYCPPMAALPVDVPVLWVCIRNQKAVVPFGKLIHIHR